jgi:hypothetical protein
MNTRERHPRFTRSIVPNLHNLPYSSDLDLREIEDMGNGSYRVRDHIEQDSEFEPVLVRWSDRNVP